MYQVRIEHQNAVRLYQADNQTDALELFDLLSKTCRFVQVWQGSKLLNEYSN
jgi:hypothetical protein